MRSFAGFWVDGDIRRPSKECFDSFDYVVAKSKKDGEFFCKPHNSITWRDIYWLDTTTPTELTPQQAFELCKALNPNLNTIHREGRSDYWLEGDPLAKADINWGDTTEYPPKKPDVWRIPTDADKGKKCRYKDNLEGDWITTDSVTFNSVWEKGFIVVYGGEALMPWKYCEVLDE